MQARGCVPAEHRAPCNIIPAALGVARRFDRAQRIANEPLDQVDRSRGMKRERLGQEAHVHASAALARRNHDLVG